MLKIEDLTVNVLDKKILDSFNMEIPDGEIHAVMGPNGVGKSTICRSILKDPNYSIKNGSIIYNGVDLRDSTTTDIARMGIMMISQSPIAIEGVTNGEMLRIALSEKNNEHIDIFSFQREVKEICEKLNIPESFIHRSINDGMSGGERKKNELLHVWMLKPSFLILDEIDSGLDVDALKEVTKSLKEYHKETNCSMLIITHNPKLLKDLNPDKVHILKNKKIAKTGSIELISEIEDLGFKNYS